MYVRDKGSDHVSFYLGQVGGMVVTFTFTKIRNTEEEQIWEMWVGGLGGRKDTEFSFDLQNLRCVRAIQMQIPRREV